MTHEPVSFRSRQRLPRITLGDKEQITGVIAAALPDEVFNVTGPKGHPLFWNESKDTDLFIALFKDLLVDHVFDVTAGSAAAACAALALDIHYEGLAMSDSHANWLDNLMDRAIFTIIAQKDDEEDKDLRKDIQCYLSALIEEGRQYVRSAEQDDDDDDDDDVNEDETMEP
jgi:hypothetical protein